MTLARPVVFPLRPILPGPACTCPQGATCSRIGKHPAGYWRDLSYGDEVPKPAPGVGAGIKTGAGPKGSGIFVVDLDGEGAWTAWQNLGGKFDTFCVSTGREEGIQLYYEHPGFPVRNSVGDLGPGIDIRGEGGFAVAPGSPHKSGKTYAVWRDAEIGPAPEWLLAWLRARPAQTEAPPYEGDVTDPVERAHRRELYAKYLATDAPARGEARRGRGDATLFEVVQFGAYDLALPGEDVLELVREHYDPRCEPMWADELEERVGHKVRSAKEQSARERRVPLLKAEQEIWDSLDVPPATPGEVIQAALVTERGDPSAPDLDAGLRICWGPWDDIPHPPQYLVDGLLVEGKVSMLYAEPGGIKSWTAVDIARCVATGALWLGERVVRQGPVLFVDFEDGKHEFHRRLHMLSGGRPITNLGYLYDPGPLDSPDLWSKLTTLWMARGCVLIVFDTLSAGTLGVDENDRNAAVPLNYAGKFTEATGASVLMIHHASKAGSIRGTSAFKGAVDSAFKLETVSETQDSHRARLTCEKSGQKKTSPINLELTDDGLRSFAYEPPAKEGEDVDKRTLDELQAQVLLLIETQGPIASKDKIRTLVSARDANVRAAMRELEAKGEIVRLDEGWVRDTDEKRRARVLGAVDAKGTWPKTALAKLAAVPLTFFDRMVLDGWIAARASGDDVVGFVRVSRSK